MLLVHEDPTVTVCPRCAVLNPECNQWRILKSNTTRVDAE